MISRPGWQDLETFTDIEQLGACYGVTVQDGHVARLDMYRWNAAELPALPPFLTDLDCEYINFQKLPDPLPTSLKSLCCNNTNIMDFPDLPPNLERLECGWMRLHVTSFPYNIGLLKANGCDITLGPLQGCRGISLHGNLTTVEDATKLDYSGLLLEMSQQEKERIQASVPECEIAWGCAEELALLDDY
jgi:hypothetical protein